MNIGFVGNVPPPIGGAEVFLKGFLERFITPSGHTGTQVRWYRQDFQYGCHAGIRRYAPAGHREHAGGLTTYYVLDSVAKHHGRPAAMAWIYDQQSVAVSKIFRRHRVELIHAHSMGNLPFAAIAARELGVPLVVTVHGLVELKNLERWRASRPELVEKFDAYLRQADLVIGVSDEIVAACRRKGARRLEKLSCGIDPQYFSPPARHAPPGEDILFVGSQREDKGALLLLEAFARLPPQSDARLVFVGKKMIEGPIVDAAERDPRVIFRGTKNAAGVRRALARARLVVLPSESEGMPLSILEAMSYQRAVLVSRTGELGNLIEHGNNGFLISRRTPASLARQIASILARKDLAAVGVRARRRAMGFHIDRVVEDHERLYESLLR